MNLIEIESNISDLVAKYLNSNVVGIVPLPRSGSSRLYFRLTLNDSKTLIGVYNPNIAENKAFIYLSNHLSHKKINVPCVLCVSNCQQYYLQSDLGKTSLFDIITAPESLPGINVQKLIENTISELVNFQVKGTESLNTSRLYPIPSFDRRSVMWDLNYFKYNFLKTIGIEIDEVALEADFDSLANFLLNDDLYFLQFHDFQSRNIMVCNSQPYFIDYQGARLGPCLYDVASFLYQAKAGFSDEFRYTMLNFYLDRLELQQSINREELVSRFPTIVAFRIMQTLGAYGFRGFFERKLHFIQSVSAALANLKAVLPAIPQNLISYISTVVNAIDVSRFEQPKTSTFDKLTIQICSFSLKKGYPSINSEHGGGFVFDCRALPNPGRFERYKMLNGTDTDVIEYLEQWSEVADFMYHAECLVINAVSNYKDRNFKYLSVAFGCTGGQHRSVYCANQLALRLRLIPDVCVELSHKELENNQTNQ